MGNGAGATKRVGDLVGGSIRATARQGNSSDGVVDNSGKAANGGDGTSTTSTTSSLAIDASSDRGAATSFDQDPKACASSNATTRALHHYILWLSGSNHFPVDLLQFIDGELHICITK